MYCLYTVPGVFSIVETTSASQPASNLIPKRLISHPPGWRICSHDHQKENGTYYYVPSCSLFYVQSHLRIPACLKFNSKMFNFTSPGWRICISDHQKESGTYYYVPSRSLFYVQIHLCIPACPKQKTLTNF